MSELLYEKHDIYAVFTLNRPERLNALGGGVMDALSEAVEDFNADPQMRVGILTGSGRAFCAGMDLKEAADRAASGDNVTGTRPNGSVQQMAFSRSPKPFIAAINGLAIGGGCEIALDLRHPHHVEHGVRRAVRAEARHHGRLRDAPPAAHRRLHRRRLHAAHRRPASRPSRRSSGAS